MTEPAPAHPAAADDEIDLGLLWRALRVRWRVVAVSTAAFAGLALLIVLLTQPVFQANGSFYLGDVSEKPGMPTGGLIGAGLGSLFGGLLGGSGVDTQVEILKSRDLMVRAIEASGLNAQVWPGDSSHPPVIRFWDWRLHGKHRSQYAPGANGLRAINSNVAAALEKAVLHVRFGAAGRYTVRGHDGKTLLEGVLDRPAAGGGLRLQLEAVHAGFVPAPGSVYSLRAVRPRYLYHDIIKQGLYSVSAAMGQGSNSQPTLVVNLDFKNADPYRAQDFLSALMNAYMAQNLSWSTDQAATAYAYLDGQLGKIRHALENADKKLADYQKRSGVIEVSANAKAMIGQMANYEMQRSAAQLRLYNLRQIDASLSAPGAHIDQYLISSIDDKVLDGLSLDLAQEQSLLTKQRQQYTDLAPQVIAARAAIARLQTSIRALVRNQARLAQKQLADLDTVIARFDAQFKKLPQAQLEVVALTRSSQVLAQIYMFLLQKQEEAALQKAGTVTNNRILDHAETSDQQVKPVPRTDLALGLFLGLFGGVAWVIGGALLAPGYRSEEELRQRYPDLNIYALLPHFHRRGQAAPFQPVDVRSGFGEAIRLLRANLYLSQRAGQDRTWMITSAASGDGKSTVCYELTHALALEGKRVLLVDADIRKPHAHEMLACRQSPGLSDLLAGRERWQACVQRIEALGFDVLPAGQVPPNPADLVGSGHLGTVIGELREAYDYVLIDTPPFPLVSDALLIARHVERVLSVVRLGKTPRGAFSEHCRRLPPMGLLVNDLGGTGGGYGYGYGYGDTGYGYVYGNNGNGNGNGKTATPWQRALTRVRKVLRR